MPHRCTATTANGRPCRAWAKNGTDPPRCHAHTEHDQTLAAYYSAAIPDGDILQLITYADQLTLNEEIAVARFSLRRLLEALQHTSANTAAEPAELARLAAATLAATRCVSRLLRDQRALSGDAADGIAGAIAQALDELGSEWGLPL